MHPDEVSRALKANSFKLHKKPTVESFKVLPPEFGFWTKEPGEYGPIVRVTPENLNILTGELEYYRAVVYIIEDACERTMHLSTRYKQIDSNVRFNRNLPSYEADLSVSKKICPECGSDVVLTANSATCVGSCFYRADVEYFPERKESERGMSRS